MSNNKIGIMPIKKLIWTMGLPMILSMVLQAIYNVVDTIFVINMGEKGVLGNEALTYAFPIQIIIIAIGVGTGVGINAMLSKNLGEGKREVVNKVAGNGIFIALIIYLLFLIFGLFFAKTYMNIMSDNAEIAKMGTDYLRICCIFSFGAIGFAVYERFLQSTGKTNYSTIAQIIGAVLNIFLDWLLIYPCNMGIVGAAVATVIGQIASLIVAAMFHYLLNKEVNGNIKYIKPSFNIIKNIYQIGLPAMIMQGLLAIMMFAVIGVIKTLDDSICVALLTGSFGIYYKIMQLALFASFGLSNTLISVVSFNYGMKDKQRLLSTIRYGIFASIVVTLIITIVYQVLADSISRLFGMSIPDVSENGVAKDEILSTCKIALHISSIGYIFMGISVAIQGLLQGFRDVYKPVIISLFRLLIFVVPFVYIFLLFDEPQYTMWWAFPITEVLTAFISYILLRNTMKNKLASI